MDGKPATSTRMALCVRALGVGLCLKGLAIGTLVGVGITVGVALVLLLLPMGMILGGAAFAGGTDGVDIAGAGFDFAHAAPDWLPLAPGAIAFVVAFVWTIRRSPPAP